MPVRKISIALEATNSQSGADRIIEIAATEYVAGQLTGRIWHSYLNPEGNIGMLRQTSAGVTNEFLEQKPVFGKIINELTAFIARASVLVYGDEKEIAVLSGEFKRCGCELELIVDSVTDLSLTCKKLQPDANFQLEAVCRRFFVETEIDYKFGETVGRSLIIAKLDIRLESGRIGKAAAQQDQASRIVIESFEQFIEATSKIKRLCLIRGVEDKDYLLLPSLFRTYGTRPIDVLERDLMWMFKNQASGIMDRLPTTELEWLTVAQHHGLPTRLLDWSLNPLVAAFFATESLSSTAGGVFLLEVNGFLQPHQVDTLNPREIAAFFPVHAARRMMAQSGAFTIHPNETNALDANALTQMIIPAEKKAIFKERLFKLGIHRGTMFPDLDGLAAQLKYMNDY